MAKRRCDKCEKSATHHSVEIIKGEKIEKHLCDECAAEEGPASKSAHAPINELLTSFVKMHSGQPSPKQEVVCDHCKLSFSEFREHSLLGCPRCYSCMEEALAPLIERAQEGGTHHVGKAPRQSAMDEQRQQRLLRLRKRLGEAVEEEDYELAAKLRDQLRQVEGEATP